MNQPNLNKIVRSVLLSALALAFFGPVVAAQSVKIEGLIKSRNGDTMIVKSSGSSDVTVQLTDSTEVGQIQGVFQARRKQKSMAALIPGLQVKVEGTYDDQKQLVAKSVSFKGNDLEDAEKIEAGMHETKVQNQQQQAELENCPEPLPPQKMISSSSPISFGTCCHPQLRHDLPQRHWKQPKM